MKVNESNQNVCLHTYSKSTQNVNFRNICKIISDIINDTNPNVIGFENISLSSFGRSVITLSELAGYLAATIDQHNIHYIAIPPTSVKKFAVDNGKAKKDIMIDAWSIKDPDTYELCKDIKSDDLADAYWICMYTKNQFIGN